MREIDHRTPTSQVQALSEEQFARIIEELTEANDHYEARVLRARRTGNTWLIAEALKLHYKHRRLGYASWGMQFDASHLDAHIRAFKP